VLALHTVPGVLARRLAGPALLVSLGACGPEVTPAPSDPAAAKLDSAMTAALQALEIPGAALTVVRDSVVTFRKAYGVADLASGRPVTDSTPFVIGSTSKPLTAMLVLRLVAAGRLALDTPIVRYVPDVHFADPRASQITLRHLLTNRSGMVAGFSGPAFERPYEQDAEALDRLVREAATRPLLFAPGTGYTYSNRGWALAGYVAQRAEGASVEELMDREVFGPLGMTGSTLRFWERDLVQGYHEGRSTRNLPGPASLTRRYGPAGMMASTNRDVGILLSTLLRQGRTATGEQWLPAELVAEMFRPQAEAESELGGPTRYGLGWEIDSTFGSLTIKKAGSVVTQVSFWVLLPEMRTGFGLLFNREDYRVVPLVANLVRVLGGGELQPFPETGPNPPFTAPTAASIARPTAEAWTGRYDTRSGDLSIGWRGDTLVTRYEGMPAVLVPADDSSAILVDDVLTHAGRRLSFRPRRGILTLWVDDDSVGVRVGPNQP